MLILIVLGKVLLFYVRYDGFGSCCCYGHANPLWNKIRMSNEWFMDFSNVSIIPCEIIVNCVRIDLMTCRGNKRQEEIKTSVKVQKYVYNLSDFYML